MSDSNRITAILAVMIVMLILIISAYNLGVVSVVSSCEHVSFFYYSDKVFECLPYKKGMLGK